MAAGAGYRGVNLRAGWERLGGDPARGQFNTPLATLHPFNGWADKFLVTPASGRDDRYVRLTGDAGRVRWTAVWHDFAAVTGGTRYGREFDWRRSTGHRGGSRSPSRPRSTTPAATRPTPSS